MQKLILTVLIFIFLVAQSFATDTRTFTDQDLKKYRRHSDTKPSDNHTDINNKVQTEGDAFKHEDEKEKAERHIIPYEIVEGMEMSIIIPVTINNYNEANMLLDTGASGMHISLDLALELGIFDRNEAMLMDFVMGVGGAVPVIVTIIDTIQIGDVDYQFIPTTISDTKFQKFSGLLGMDFMTNYSVHIDNKKHEIVFEERPELSKMPAGRSETWWRVTFRNFRLTKERWKRYRDNVYAKKIYSSRQKRLKKAADIQYRKADSLLTKLNVYASVHSVPLEWR